jgi:site-specific DNA recombinase
MAELVEQAVAHDLCQLKVQLPEREDASDELARLKKEEGRTARKLKRLYLLYAEGEDEQLRALITQVKNEYAGLQEAITQAARTAGAVQKTRKMGTLLAGLGDGWAALSQGEKRKIVLSCVDHLTLTPDQMQIYYHFPQPYPCP